MFHETGYNSHMISLIRIIYRKNRAIVSNHGHALSAVNALPFPVGLSGSSSEKYNSSYIVNFPATHGLDAARKPSSRLSTHAALVSLTKTAHELPRIKNRGPQITQINTDYKQGADFRRGEPPCSPIYYSSFTPRFHDKLSQAQSIRPNQVIPHEKSPEPAQGMYHIPSLAPQGLLHFSYLIAYKIIQGET